MTIELRLARPEDVPAITKLIESESMPAMEVEERVHGFFVLDDGGTFVGCAGLEVYGEAAIIRSVVVAESLRGTGEGIRIVERCLQFARENGAKRCYLFTMSAVTFFPRFGFERCTLEDFEPAARDSWQYRGVSEHQPLRDALIPMRATL